MEKGNEIRIEQIGAVTLLGIKGDVTPASQGSITGAYKTASGQGAKAILLQFDPDTYINSGGIALLIQLLSETRKNKQQVGMTGLSDHFKKIFNMVGITKFVTIYGTMEEALGELFERLQ